MARRLFILFAVILTLAACSAAPTPQPPEPLAPTPFAALPTAQPPEPFAETPQPTIPEATAAPSPVVTRVPQIAPSQAPAQPTILQRFNLLTLPGTGRSPAALAQLGSTLYVANRSSDNIAVIRERQMRALIPTARGPVALAADAANGRIYVGTYVTPTIMLIQNDVPVRSASVPNTIMALAVTPDRLLAGLGNAPVIEVRDPVTLEKKGEHRLSSGFDVMSLVVDEARHRLYAGVYEHVIMLDLDSLQELRTVVAPQFFGSLAVNPDDGSLWAGIFDATARQGAVASFSTTGQPLRQVMLDNDLRGPAFDNNGRYYVPSSFMNRLDVVDAATGKLVTQIPVGLSPMAVLVDSSAHLAYVANGDGDSISVVDTQAWSIVATIPLGMRVTALLAADERSRVYAANASTASVFVIENGKFVKEVKVGHHPVDLARDPKTNTLFVADYADGAVNVIDENALTVQATLPITRNLSSVAVDPINRHLMAGSTMLNLDTKAVEGVYLARGGTVGSLIQAQLARMDPARSLLYAVASNGTPGSNSRLILYRFAYGRPDQSTVLPNPPNGNITALAIDSDSGTVYAGDTHPLAYNNALVVWDARGDTVGSIAVTARIAGVALNPDTHHLYVTHSNTFSPSLAAVPPRDNTVQIFDTRTLGDVGWLDVPGAPGPVTRLGNTIYVAGRDDGSITLIGDAPAAQPPAPTRTPTLTPYPTWTPTRVASPVANLVATAPPLPVPAICSNDPGAPFQDMYNRIRTRLGCATGPSETRTFAYQPFQGGFMYADFANPAGKQVDVFFDDHSYRQFPDMWMDGMPVDSCPQISFANGVKPIRGFGKIWCENKDVQSKLPVAILAEVEVTLGLQRFERGSIWVNKTLGTFAILDDGTWQ